MHPNETVLRRAFAAFAAGDVPVLREVLAPDASWSSAGRNWLVGSYHGLDEILALFATIGAYSEGTYRVELHDVWAKESSAVALYGVSASRSDGKSMSLDAVLACDLADGRLKAVRSWPWDLYAEDAYYGTAPPVGLEAPRRSVDSA